MKTKLLQLWLQGKRQTKKKIIPFLEGHDVFTPLPAGRKWKDSYWLRSSTQTRLLCLSLLLVERPTLTQVTGRCGCLVEHRDLISDSAPSSWLCSQMENHEWKPLLIFKGTGESSITCYFHRNPQSYPLYRHPKWQVADLLEVFNEWFDGRKSDKNGKTYSKRETAMYAMLIGKNDDDGDRLCLDDLDYDIIEGRMGENTHHTHKHTCTTCTLAHNFSTCRSSNVCMVEDTTRQRLWSDITRHVGWSLGHMAMLTIFLKTRCHMKPLKMLSASSRVTMNNMNCCYQEGFWV